MSGSPARSVARVLTTPRAVFGVHPDEQPEIRFALDDIGNAVEALRGEPGFPDVRGDEDPRPEIVRTREVAGGHQASDGDIAEGADTRAPQGGDPGFERTADLGEPGSVGVGVEESGQDEFAGDIHLAGGGGRRLEPDREDAAAADEDIGAGHRPGADIEHRAAHQREFGLLGRGREGPRNKQRRQGERANDHGVPPGGETTPGTGAPCGSMRHPRERRPPGLPYRRLP